MSVLRRTFASRAAVVHTAVFIVASVAFVVLDASQGVDSEVTVLGLDWAHVLILIWLPIIATHLLFTWWGARVIDDLEKETIKGLWGWFGGSR